MHGRETSIRLGIYHRIGLLGVSVSYISPMRRGLWLWVDCQSPLVPFVTSRLLVLIRTFFYSSPFTLSLLDCLFCNAFLFGL